LGRSVSKRTIMLKIFEWSLPPRAPPGYAYALKVVSKVEVKLNLLLLDRGLLA